MPSCKKCGAYTKYELCLSCYKKSKTNSDNNLKFRKSTPQAEKLYYALKRNGVPAEREKWDHHKHIDIAIPTAKVNIEVDGQHHNFDDKQAFSDLQRTYYSFEKGYITLRIPNSLIENRFEQTVSYVVDIINKNREKLAEQKEKNKNSE